MFLVDDGMTAADVGAPILGPVFRIQPDLKVVGVAPGGQGARFLLSSPLSLPTNHRPPSQLALSMANGQAFVLRTTCSVRLYSLPLPFPFSSAFLLLQID
jgi:hypothetical protein